MITLKEEKRGREPSKDAVKHALVTQSSAISVGGASSGSSSQLNEKEPQKEQTNIQPKRSRSPKKKKPEGVWWKQDFKLILVLIVVLVLVVLGEQFHDDHLITAIMQLLNIIIQLALIGKLAKG